MRIKSSQKSFSEVRNHLADAAYRARIGDYADAASLLNTGYRMVQDYLRSGIFPEQGIKKILYSLETMYVLQKQDDWVALADVIEYEFIPLLGTPPGLNTTSAT
ncbi:MAG: hypothetical protein GF401_04875 [Chitinivibrionales bacterium]|nr:hypothetical protein [Chitinivibrionales bacterium]